MMSDNTANSNDPRATRLAALKREYAERRASLPAHSVSAAQLIRLEELEDEIAALRAAMASEAAQTS
jgi:ribosomal protein L29